MITDSKWFKRFFKIRRELAGTQTPYSPCLYWQASRIAQALSCADHASIKHDAQNLLRKNRFIGYFYYAQSLTLQNRLSEAKYNLNLFLNRFPNHAEATYLYAEIETIEGNTETAWAALENLLRHTKRRKTWQFLSNLVNTPQDFDRYLDLFRQKYDYQNDPLPFDLNSHLSNAALRAGRADFALNLWRSQHRFLTKDNPGSTPKIQLRAKYTDRLASEALKTLKACLDQAGIPFFLISGTLLGCIREQKLLGHDKDIDVGVWETHTTDELKAVVRNSGYFYILPNKSEELAVVRHVNGITIDIFIHHREEHDYWHAGGKSKWHNTPFKLVSRDFLNDQYLIPENFDLYLTENYGDWKTPNTHFDSALDTPNMEVTSTEEMLIYLYKRIFLLKNTNPRLTQRMYAALRKFGENIQDPFTL